MESLAAPPDAPPPLAAAEEHLYELGHAPLEDAPDLVLQLTLQHLAAPDLCSTRLVSQRMKEQASEGPLWVKLSRRTFKSDASSLEGTGVFAPQVRRPPRSDAVTVDGVPCSFAPGVHAMRRFALWHGLQQRWTPRRRPAPDSPFRDHIVAQCSSGPVFCCNAVSSDVFACAGGEGIVRLIGLVQRPLSAQQANEFDKDSDSEEEGLSEAKRKGFSAAELAEIHAGRAFLPVVKGSWSAHSGGMLGMSVDKQARTVLTGAFNGEASLWRMLERRPEIFAKLSVVALKSLLSARGIPFADCTEKSELEARLAQRSRVVDKLCSLDHPMGETVVSTAVWRDVCVTGSRDGTARVSRIVEGDGASASAAYKGSFRGGGSADPWAVDGSGCTSLAWGRKAAAPWPGLPGAPARLSAQPVACLRSDSSIDVVHLDPRFGRCYTGDKAGVVRLFDLAAGGTCLRTFKHGESWVWVVRSAATWSETGGHEPGAPRCGLGEDHPGGHFAGGSRSGAEGADGEGDDAAEEDEPDALEEIGDGLFEPVREADPVRMLREPEPEAAPVEYMGDGNALFTGCTLGEVRLYDLRASRCVHRVRIAPGAGLRDFQEGGGAPITGILPDYQHSRFTTSSFDGCMRVWDLRSFRPVLIVRASGERLARCDITPTMAAAGGMDGALHILDFLGGRGRSEMLGLA